MMNAPNLRQSAGSMIYDDPETLQGGPAVGVHDMECAIEKKKEEPLLGDVVPAGSITFHADYCEGMHMEQLQGAFRQDVITVTVPLSVIRKLPVFKDLWESTVQQEQCGKNSPRASAESTHKRSRPHTVPFTPPVAIWAFVSLLLVLEDKSDLWNLFGNVGTDPKLAAHTILMSDFCGDETAGGKVRTWLYRQAMLRVATLCTSSADVSHCAPVVWHLSEVFLALPEEHMPFIDESQRKPASSAGLIATGKGPDEGEKEGESRVSVRFALHLPPPLLNAWLRRQRRVTVDFRELQYEDGPTALVALTGARKQNMRLSVAAMHSKCAPLTAVQACLVSLTSLRKLHFHGMPVYPGDLTFLGVVARGLSGTLVHLTLCNFDGSTCCVPVQEKSRDYAPVHKELFFKTISLFSGLQTLQLTTLLSFLQGQDLMILAPLKSMRDLKTVIFSRQGSEEGDVMALEKYAVANLSPELKLLDAPCTLCA